MQVQELIERLNKMSPDSKVVIGDDQGSIYEIEDTLVVEAKKFHYEDRDSNEQYLVIV